MMWGRSIRSLAAKNTPKSAQLSASVPPDVKTTSVGSHPMSMATFSRAASTASRAAAPAQCALDGLPNSSVRHGVMASTTSGASGVEALKSR